MTRRDEHEMAGAEDGVGPADGRHRRQRSDLANAVVMLCGTAEHDAKSKLNSVEAVSATVRKLKAVLTEHCGVRDVIMVLNPPTPAELGDAVSLATRRAEDILFIYYVGHGLVSSEGKLYLAARQTDSRPRRVAHTGLPYQTVRQYVRESRAHLKIVILDCCFSGKAIGPLGAPDQETTLAAIDGAFVLTSAGRDEVALAPPGAEYTAFSGELITLLTIGDPHAGRDLTLEEVYLSLSRSLQAAGYPTPRRLATGRVDELVLRENPAHGEESPPPPPPPPPPPVGLIAASGAALAGTVSVPLLASAVHDDGWHYLPFGVRGSVLASLWSLVLLVATGGLAAVAARRLVNRRIRLPAWGRRRRPRLALATTLTVVLAAGLGAGTVEAAAAGRVWLADCPPAGQLRVLASPDGYESTKQLARAFELHTAGGNFDCPEIQVLVYAEPPDETRAAFRRGWSDDDRVRIGPRPDVWLPDSAAEVRTAREQAAGTLPVAENHIVAVTPLVVAVPSWQSGSGGVQGPTVTGDSWPSLFDTLTRLGWNVVAPNPGTATGDLARVALYSAVKGDPARTVAPASTQTIERYVEGSHDRAAYVPGADQTRLLCALRQRTREDREKTAVIVTEQSLARFNQGAALGPTCGVTAQLGEEDRLTALYPVATPVLDRPFVRLAWGSMTDAQHAAARRFGVWLDTPDGRQALNDVGLRPPGFPLRAPLSFEFGVWPFAPFEPMPTGDDVLAAARTTYAKVHRPGRILLALDASGSMAGKGPDGRALWTVAAQGVTDSMGLMGPRDEFGAWAFQGAGGVRKLVPIGRRDEPVRGTPRRDATSDALAAVRPGGPAPLYDTVVAGVQQVGPTTAERVTALVILTDGEGDNASDITASQLEMAVAGRHVRVFALAVGTTSCRASALARITRRTGGFCLEAEAATMREQISAVFDALWDAGPGRS